MNIDGKGEVRVLHFSDIHVGMDGQGWMWSSFKKAFLDDLRRMHRRTGDWHIVIFSGDLVQKGSAAEYTRLSIILKEIWALFLELGFNPLLVAVPGNHDLERPNELDPTAIAINEWWANSRIQGAFWASSPKEYRELIDASFLQYKNWLAALHEFGINVASSKAGLLPGDCATEFVSDHCSLGVVGLNSAWLQLSSGNAKGRLHVDPRQFMAVTDNAPDEWCGRHDFNVLVTHHPQDWLHSTSISLWRSEINLTSRFDAHLFGHMHEPATTSIAEGGGDPRRFIQAASLFGLELVSPEETKRIHGYSIIEFKGSNANRSIKLWPRKGYVGLKGSYKLIGDPDFELEDDEHIVLLGPNSVAAPAAITTNPVLAPVVDVALLRAVRKLLPDVGPFANVRKVEQRLGLNALREKRALWLVSEWGLGSDQFIKLLQLEIKIDPTAIYQLDVHACKTKDDIFSVVDEQLHCSFEHFCELLSLQSVCILVVDDIPLFEGIDAEKRSLQHDIEGVVNILLQYCAELRIILRTRRAPVDSIFRVLELRPLDEADTRAYVVLHEQGGIDRASVSFVSQLFRHTDGIPSKIDAALRDAQIVGASQLHSLNFDVAGKAAASQAISPGLAAALDAVRVLDGTTESRAFKLLRVLMMFPRGEQLATVKRFYFSKPFHPADAKVLLEAALVDATEIPSIEPIENDSGKALVVRRPVREYLYSNTSISELKALNKRALSIYFGARKKGAIVAANNILLNLAAESGDGAEKKELVQRVSRSAAQDGDNHNSMRASILLATLLIKEGRLLSQYELSRLVDAYHYLYGEDMHELFENAHRALWTTFEKNNEIGNLLRLFRYSSLRWRLRGLEATELSYAKRLGALMGGVALALKDIYSSDREVIYFIARAGKAWET